MTTTASGAPILIKATGFITTGAGASISSQKLFQTVGGPITLWADAENNLSGRIGIGNFNRFNSQGGRITIAGGLDDGGVNADISAAVVRTAGDGFPDGYARAEASGNASATLEFRLVPNRIAIWKW
jgi:hypothetical protein